MEDFEVIAANRGEHFLGSTFLPEWSGIQTEMYSNDPAQPGAWLLEEDGLYHNPEEDIVRMTISPEDVEKLKEVADYRSERTCTKIADALQPDGYDELCRLNVCKSVPGAPLIMMQSGHLSPGYKKLINMGIGAIGKQARDWIEGHNGNLMGEDTKKYLFYKSAAISCDALTILIKRYGEECYSERTKVYKAGLYSAADHVGQGYTTWATPDRRKAGEPIADAASPAQGRDKHGPTAVCLSELCYDRSKFMDGVCVNLRIHPTAVSNEEGLSKLRMMPRTYFNQGGAEIQYSIVGSDTMREARPIRKNTATL